MKKVFAGIALLSVLAACNSTPAPGNKPMTQQTADQLELVAPGMANTLVNGLRERGQVGGSSDRARTQATGVCNVTGNIADNDKDGIAADVTTSFQDCTVDYLLFFTKKNGTASVKDGNDSDPNSGFTTKATNLKLDYLRKNGSNPGNPFLTLLSNWDVTVATTASSVNLAYASDFAVSTYQGDSSTVDKTWKLGVNVNGSYVAASDGDPDNFDAGTVNLTGRVNYTDDKNDLFVFNMTVTSLVFNESCAAGPVSGKVRFDDGTNGNFFEATYTGCNSGNFVYNNTGSGNF
jgi:hypothetical protein